VRAVRHVDAHAVGARREQSFENVGLTRCRPQRD
jgi:hypothetical protein